MLSEISNLTWLEKQKVIIDFKYHLIRENIYSEISNITWLEKDYVIRDFEYNLIRESICY